MQKMDQEESFMSKNQSEASAEIDLGAVLGSGAVRENSCTVKEGGEGESEEGEGECEGEEEELPYVTVTEDKLHN